MRTPVHLAVPHSSVISLWFGTKKPRLGVLRGCSCFYNRLKKDGSLVNPGRDISGSQLGVNQGNRIRVWTAFQKGEGGHRSLCVLCRPPIWDWPVFNVSSLCSLRCLSSHLGQSLGRGSVSKTDDVVIARWWAVPTQLFATGAIHAIARQRGSRKAGKSQAGWAPPTICLTRSYHSAIIPSKGVETKHPCPRCFSLLKFRLFYERILAIFCRIY
jgi:hypothetical protein